MLPELDPVLEHNRKTFNRLLYWKRLVALIGVILAPGVMLLAGPSYIVEALIGFFLLGMLAIFGLEAARVRVFYKDVKERRECMDPTEPTRL